MIEPTATAEPTTDAIANHRMMAERGALVSVSGPLDTAAVVALRTQLDAATAQLDNDYVAVDLSGSTRPEPELFTMLADMDARLRTRAARLVVIGLGSGEFTCMDETKLWAAFTLYRASRQRLHPRSANGTTAGADTPALLFPVTSAATQAPAGTRLDKEDRRRSRSGYQGAAAGGLSAAVSPATESHDRSSDRHRTLPHHGARA